jgi:predicted HNH restriction endonuclease
MKRRSQLGGDVMSNLITLCANCHGKCHGRGQSNTVARIDASPAKG